MAPPGKTSSRRRKAAFVLIFILGGSIVIPILALNSSFFKVEEKLPTHYQRGYINPITNETMHLGIRLESETYSAHTWINATASLFPDHEARRAAKVGYGDLPDTYYVVFDGSGCKEAPNNRYGRIDACAVEMKRDDLNNYVGDNMIRFGQGGQFAVIVTPFNTTRGDDFAIPNVVQIEPLSTTLDRQYFTSGLLGAIILQGIAIIVAAAALRKQP